MAGDFEAWYGGAHGRLVATLTAIYGQPELAAEAVDEAFVRAYERWSDVYEMESPEGWVFTVARNVLRRMKRRERLERVLALRTHQSPQGGVPQGFDEALWKAVQELPERMRQAICLRYVMDLSERQTAHAMGVAGGTVGATLHKARARLRDALQEPKEQVSGRGSH